MTIASAQPSETVSKNYFVGLVAIEVIAMSTPTTLNVTEAIDK